ncbi:unnamed protein product [marine sediment metagenome]|uniref:Uncharacterized protein n=1 Tax=marine sediment metagenome TaxID=412755 RepID=X0WPF6_9ZZZZ
MAEANKAIPMVKMIWIRKIGKMKNIFRLIDIPYKNIIRKNMIPAIIKSTTAAMTEAMGNISLGKYIFVTMLVLLTKLGIAKESEVANNVHGRRALYEKIG